MTSDAVRPNTTADLDIGNDLKRSMIPFCMSSARPDTGKCRPEDDRLGEDPAHQELTIRTARNVNRSAKHVGKQQNEHDR